MGNTYAFIRPSKEASPSLMGGSTMVETRGESGEGTSIAEQITRSECHWSERVESECSIEEEMADNREVFKSLQSHPTWGPFFKTFGYDTEEWVSSGELVVDEKPFAEGGQAELVHAKVTWRNRKQNAEMLEEGYEYVLKVFKKGTLLRHLQSQWPQGYLKFCAETIERTELNLPQPLAYNCDIDCGTLLKDGRFAFLMAKETEDLRSLIERNMSSIGEGHGPFSKETAEIFMFRVAQGMDWLHSRNIVHRDLKASNVLFTKDEDGWACCVADFECSIGVVGTGFFRAPEVLQAIKDKALSQKPEVFSNEADVYSYGMTCYEILTGKLPFEGHPMNDYDIVLKEGQRPEVPEYVDDWARELLRRCWQEDPGARPSFGEIVDLLLANSAAIRECQLSEQQRKKELGIEDMLVAGSSSGGTQ